MCSFIVPHFVANLTLCPTTDDNFKVQMKCSFFIVEFERAANIRKIAVHRFLISLLLPELQRFKDEWFQIQKCPKKLSKSMNIKKICDVMCWTS